jgi:predicted transcriptional regulator
VTTLGHDAGRASETQIERLRWDIAIGIKQADRGEVVPAEKVFADLRKTNKAIRRKK